jgi:hypothetical protein
MQGAISPLSHTTSWLAAEWNAETNLPFNSQFQSLCRILFYTPSTVGTRVRHRQLVT